jgi:hypothetical protein
MFRIGTRRTQILADERGFFYFYWDSAREFKINPRSSAKIRVFCVPIASRFTESEIAANLQTKKE